MSEAEINGKEFILGKMTPRIQFHVARRLAPIFAAMAKSGSLSLDNLNFDALAEAIATLKDEDADYILDSCLAVVKHRDETGKVYPIAIGKAFRYDWIDMPMMLRLAFEVIQENMSGFMPTVPSDSNEAAAD